MYSFAVTAYNETIRPNRRSRILECISAAQEHPLIDEIFIVDDGSEDYFDLADLLMGQKKVRLYHNSENRGVFSNKIEAVYHSSNEWVITCDSDNIMSEAYLSLVGSITYDYKTWYCPSYAKPNFDYRHLCGSYALRPELLARSILDIMSEPRFDCFMNTGNQVVHRKAFLNVFAPYLHATRADLMFPNWLGLSQEERHDPKWRLVFDAKDSFILNLYWLKAGGRLQVVQGQEYLHYFTTGNESNYCRAPAEKDQLNEKLLQDLRESCDG